MNIMGTRKKCLITGAANGLGYEFARLAAGDGYDLHLIDLDAGRLKSVKEILEKEFGISVTIYFADIGEPAVFGLLESVLRELPFDILINNAGFGLFGKISETNWDLEEKMIRLHVMVPTYLSKKILADMIVRGSGKIMNVSSMAAFQPGPYSSVYFATKAYLRSFSLAVAQEIKGTGVSVTVFCPGVVRTNFADQVALRSNSVKSKVQKFSVDPVWAARKGYQGMIKGKQIVIPGWKNKLLSALSHLLPATTAASLNGKIQKRIRRGERK